MGFVMGPVGVVGAGSVTPPDIAPGVDSGNRLLVDFVDFVNIADPDMDPYRVFELAVRCIAVAADRTAGDTLDILDIVPQAAVPDLQDTADLGQDLAGAGNSDLDIPDLGLCLDLGLDLGFGYPFFVFLFGSLAQNWQSQILRFAARSRFALATGSL